MSTSSPVPSRRILTSASRANSELGHENLGFLSEEHGLAPARPPLLEMPPSHRAWDQIAADLPHLFRTLKLRQLADELPVLRATQETLSDDYLLRASALMSMLAHSYVRVRVDPPEGLPASIEHPWQDVSRRLGRRAPVLSYIDLIIYNWKFRDPTRLDPMRVENLDLLIPTVGSKEEDVLYLTQVEIVAQSAPIVGAIVRAQEAVTEGDVDWLERELIVIIERLQHAGEVSFQKIDPNPRGATFVDPVLLGKTVAPFAVPITSGVPGPSGTSSPIVHLMDVFLGRATYASLLGEEALGIRAWYPQHWLEFLEAVSKVSLREFVSTSGNTHLQGVFQSLMDTYASDKGFLGIHRLKVYGYLETMFKMGRSVTIGGFTGLFREQAWAQAFQQLSKSRDERFLQLRTYQTFGLPFREFTPASSGDAAPASIRHIPFDVSGTGIQYRPGDRVGILAENSPDLIDRTLRALRASGDEIVRLDAVWQAAVEARHRHDSVVALPLATFLKFGRLRPVRRPIAKALLALTASSKLRQIINERNEDQWELWDLLDLLYDGGFDSRRLWKAEPWEAESVCKIIPPEVFRLYSISSAMPDGEQPGLMGGQTLDLTVRRLEYQTTDSATSHAAVRRGAASGYLHHIASMRPDERRSPVSLKVIASPRFHLPADQTRPIVMFAGGAGIAPFRGFMQERGRCAGSGENWLFFGTRDPHQLFFREELEEWVRQSKMHLRVAYSEADLSVRFDPSSGGRLIDIPASRGRIDAAIEDDENARMLWNLLRSEKDGGESAYFYVCGQTGFAVTVMKSLRAVMQRYCSGRSDDERVARANEMFCGLFAERRYLQDIFTTYSGAYQERPNPYNASDIVLHNNAEHGYWFVIDGRVYDMTEFVHLHAGGPQIIRNSLGMDATRAYQNVMHHLNSEVDAMLGMYEIGHIRRLSFRQEGGVAVGQRGLFYISLENAFKSWVRYLYLIVEMENALESDFGVLNKTTTRDEPAELLTPLKIQTAAETHRRFLGGYLDDLLGDDLQHLWAITSGLCAPSEDVRWIRQQLDEIESSQAAVLTRECAGIMQKTNDQMLEPRASEGTPFERLRGLCALIERQDRQFLAKLKMTIREGVMVFEEHEDQTVARDGSKLLSVLQRIPMIVNEYYAGVSAEMLAVGVGPANVSSGLSASLAGDLRRRTASEIRNRRASVELPGHGMVVGDVTIGETDAMESVNRPQ